MVYDMDEAGFSLGALAWVDRSVNVLAAPAPDGSSYGLVITREPLTKDLTEMAIARIQESGRALRGHRLLGERTRVLGGLHAVEVRFVWKSEEGSMFHHQAFVAVAGKLLTFTATSRAALADACEAWMSDLLDTLQFRGG